MSKKIPNIKIHSFVYRMTWFKWYDTFWMMRSSTAPPEPTPGSTTVASIASMEDLDNSLTGELWMLVCGLFLLVIGVFKPELFGWIKRNFSRLI